MTRCTSPLSYLFSVRNGNSSSFSPPLLSVYLCIVRFPTTNTLTSLCAVESMWIYLVPLVDQVSITLYRSRLVWTFINFVLKQRNVPVVPSTKPSFFVDEPTLHKYPFFDLHSRHRLRVPFISSGMFLWVTSRHNSDSAMKCSVETYHLEYGNYLHSQVVSRSFTRFLLLSPVVVQAKIPTSSSPLTKGHYG